MSTDNEQSSTGGASHQERAHADHATDWMRPPSYLLYLGGGMAVVGGVLFVLNSTSMNGLFLLGFLLAVLGIGLAGLATEELPDDSNGPGQQRGEFWDNWSHANRQADASDSVDRRGPDYIGGTL